MSTAVELRREVTLMTVTAIQIGLDPEVHVIRGGRKDNFWMMGLVNDTEQKNRLTISHTGKQIVNCRRPEQTRRDSLFHRHDHRGGCTAVCIASSSRQIYCLDHLSSRESYGGG